MIELKRREFDGLKRGGELAEALGDIVSDLLGHLSVVANPYYLQAGSVGTATRYTLNFKVTKLADGSESEVLLTYGSSGTESSAKEVIDTLISRHKLVRELYLQSYTDDPKNQYFTVVAKEGYKISKEPELNNITISPEQVQASIGKPCAYAGLQDLPSNPYPRLIVTPMPVVTVDDKFKRGTIEEVVNGKTVHFPFSDSYIKASYKVTVESGEYDEVVAKGRTSAESILRRIKTKLGIEKHYTDLITKIDATINSEWNVVPSPMIGSTGNYNTASVTVVLDVIDRYVERDDGYGGIFTKVIISDQADLRHEGNPNAEIPMGQSIQRPDHQESSD